MKVKSGETGMIINKTTVTELQEPVDPQETITLLYGYYHVFYEAFSKGMFTIIIRELLWFIMKLAAFNRDCCVWRETRGSVFYIVYNNERVFREDEV